MDNYDDDRPHPIDLLVVQKKRIDELEVALGLKSDRMKPPPTKLQTWIVNKQTELHKLYAERDRLGLAIARAEGELSGLKDAQREFDAASANMRTDK